MAEEASGVRPLLSIQVSDLSTRLPPKTHLLIDAPAIERFLRSVDGTPPDWATVYGLGRDDPAHDERLFKLNRERDARREGNDVLRRRIAFVWDGELSALDPETGGFRVALGPRVTITSWGLVRFKYEDLPGNLIAVLTANQQTLLLSKIQQGQLIEIDVVMTGTLIPDESIVYDFSHEQEGMGLIMPVIRVDEILYLLHP